MPFVECFSLGIGQLVPTSEGNTVSLGSFFCSSQVYRRCVLSRWNDFLPFSDGLAWVAAMSLQECLPIVIR